MTDIDYNPWVPVLGAGVGIDPEQLSQRIISILLRLTNNLINVSDANELYVDLQLPAGVKPEDELPIGVNIGRVLEEDWWIATGTLIAGRTTSGDIVKVLYANDGSIYFDSGAGFEKMLTFSDLETTITALSTDFKVPTAKAVWDVIQVIDGGFLY